MRWERRRRAARGRPEPSRVDRGHRGARACSCRAVPCTENTVHGMKGWAGELAGPGRERERSGSVPRVRRLARAHLGLCLG